MANVALVVLDTLRKDSFDNAFDWLPGRRFTNAYSTGSFTVPAHASLFVGKYPSELGVHSKNRNLDCSEPTLAELISNSGYNTKSYSCNPYISNAFGFDRGFNDFCGSWRLKHLDPDLFDWKSFISKTRDDGPTRYLKALWGCVTGDCETISSLKHGLHLKTRGMDLFDNGIRDDGAEECLEYIRNETFDSDEFLFINLMEAHAPYVPPQEYRTVELGKSPGLFESISGSVDADPETVRQAYEDSVKYLSDIYKKIFEELSDDFDYIITLGDHGEMFGNHGMWTHVHGVYPELTHIPLVISGDGVSGTEETPVSLLDVHRTVLNITGVEAESRGQDLLDDVSQVGRITEYHGLIQDRVYRLSQQDISDDLIDKYDSELRGVLLAGGYYGYETVDRFMEVGKSVDDPQERLSEIIADLSVREVESENNEKLSQETLDQLEDLGYA